MDKQPNEFEASFTNEKTNEVQVFKFTLKEYIQACQWMAYPKKPDSATKLVRWLMESNLNRQAAYCAVRVWKDTHTKGAP